MRGWIVATAALAALGACGRSTEKKAEAPQPRIDYQQRLQALPEAGRNGVFFRAITDAGLECRHVRSSRAAPPHRGLPVWVATCAGGPEWTIVIGANGVAQVLNPAEAKLLAPPAGNTASPKQR